jgi:CBS domain containing-hemolysin-like protein
MLLLLLFVLLILSAFFSGSETAFVSLSDIRVQHLVENGRRGMVRVQKLKKNNERLIITVLVGNNLVNIAASSVATVLAVEHFGSRGLGLAVGIMTFIILVFGEISPKTIALAKNEAFAVTAAPVIQVLQFAVFPLILFLEVIARLFSRPLSAGELAPLITEAEIKSVVSLGEELGEVQEDERIMIHNIFRFSDLEVYEIMTDRTQIFSVPATNTADSAAPEIVRRGFSRVPVYDENPDSIIGILYVKDVLDAIISGRGDISVRELARPVMFIPDTMLLDDLLQQFQSKKVHMAMVVDEHGGVAGLVTIEDLLEEIVGEIVDETDREPERIRKISPTKALVLGETEVEEVNKALDLCISEEDDYETISGYILSQVRRIPKQGETITTPHAIIRVTQADAQRIIEVEIEKLPKAQEGEDAD